MRACKSSMQVHCLKIGTNGLRRQGKLYVSMPQLNLRELDLSQTKEKDALKVLYIELLGLPNWIRTPTSAKHAATM